MTKIENSASPQSSDISEHQQPMHSEDNSDEISLVDLLIVLWKGKWIIAACTLFVTVAGVIYALLAPEVFSTSSIFITKTGSKSTGNLGQLAALAGMSIGSSGNIDPSDYLDKVIQDKSFIATLFERKWYCKGDSLPLETILKIEPDTTVPNWKYRYFMAKIESIRKGNVLSMKKDAKTGLLTLSTNAPDPQLAYDLNIFTLDYISFYIRNSIQSQAKEKRLFIEDRIKESIKVLEKSENALATFRGRNLMTQAPQALLEETRLSRDVAMNQELYIQFQKQFELARIEEMDDQTLIQVVLEAEVPVYRSKPKRKQVVLLSFFIGTIIGIVFVVMYRIFYPAIYSVKSNEH